MPPNTPTGPGARLGHVAGVLERIPRAPRGSAAAADPSAPPRAARCRRSRRRTARRRRARRAPARRRDRCAARRDRRVELVRRRRSVIDSRPSHRLLPELLDVAAPGEAAGHADDRDRLVGVRTRARERGAGGAPASSSACASAAGVGAAKNDRRRDLGHAERRAACASSAQRQQRVAAELEEVVEARRPGRGRAPRRTRAQISGLAIARPARGTAVPARAARSSAPAARRDRACRWR